MASSPLSDRQQLFVELYFRTGCNALEAYKRAGYSAKTAEHNSSRLMALPKIQRAIAQMQRHNARRSAMSREEFLAHMEGIIRNHMNPARDRVYAGVVWSRATGNDRPQAGDGRHLDLDDLSAMPTEQLMQSVNRRLVAIAPPRPQIIDV